MTFLKNTWYCAGWASELNDEPKAITILNEHLVLFRDTNGRAVALEDRCPHRFAPLSRGKIQGDTIACGYHGLVFSAAGKCVHNPQGEIPNGCEIKSYVSAESQGAIWVWMGDVEKANTDTIMDMGEVHGDEGWKTLEGYLRVESHYEMVVDNLLDLGHVPYLHSFLAAGGERPANYEEKRKLEVHSDHVWARFWKYHCPVSPIYKLLWDEAPDIGTLRGHMRWQAPGVLYFDAGFSNTDGDEKDGICFPQTHLITPETETSCHYFWAVARNKKTDDEKLDQTLSEQVSKAFKYEDEPMVNACFSRMEGADLLELKPTYLAGDVAGMRARRKLREMIRKEQDDFQTTKKPA